VTTAGVASTAETRARGATLVLFTLAVGQFLMTLDTSLTAYRDARITGLKSGLAIFALATVVALFFTQRIPRTQPKAAAAA
jgi:hypothetical protein